MALGGGEAGEGSGNGGVTQQQDYGAGKGGAYKGSEMRYVMRHAGTWGTRDICMHGSSRHEGGWETLVVFDDKLDLHAYAWVK